MEYIGSGRLEWLTNALKHPKLTDLCINGEESVFMDMGEGLTQVEGLKFKEGELRSWILNELSDVGKTWDAKYPFVDATLKSGHRVHVAFPPLSRLGLLLSFRALQRRETKVRWNESNFQFLSQLIQKGESLLISGATGSGKTTLASDLLEEILPQERIIALEDTPELSPKHPHFVSLITRPPNADGFGEVTLRDLLKQTLRMRPDRIVLGECRGAEVLELLQALNTGHHGALATLHANSPRDALRRIELLCLLSSRGSLPSSAIRELLATGVQWIVQVKKRGSTRDIHQVFAIEGREGDTILCRPVLECL